MNQEDLRMLQKGQRFRPFYIDLVDGGRLMVRDPDFIFLPPKSRAVHVTDGEGHTSIVNVTIIVKCGYIDELADTPPRSNGENN